MKRTDLPPGLSFKCPKVWGEMKGDDRRRFCDGCQLHVHNLSAMSRRAGERLLANRGEHRCVIYQTRADGRMATSSRWTRLRRSSGKVLRGFMAALALAFPALAGSRLLAGPVDPKDECGQHADHPLPRPSPDELKLTMGIVAMPLATPSPSPSPSPGGTHPVMGRVAPSPHNTK